MRKFTQGLFYGCLFLIAFPAFSQQTAPENGVADPRLKTYALTHAMVVKEAGAKPEKSTVLIREGKIVAIAPRVNIPESAVVIDFSGKYIYPSFIDIYSDYGIPETSRRSAGFNPNAAPQIQSLAPGQFGWNESLKSTVHASDLFRVDDKTAAGLRAQGFGTVLTHQHDGIARGTGTLVSLASQNENFVILKEGASAHFSFSRGSSAQTYPRSIMGVIALLRQTFLDAQWYKTMQTAPQGIPVNEGLNKGLQAWNDNLKLPAIFEANDKWNNLRADNIGDEFGIQFILKGGGNEYERLQEMKMSGASFILPLNFPKAMDVEDPNEARFVSLSDMKHWEMAPLNPARFEKAGIPFALTAADLEDSKDFIKNLRKAIAYGLTEEKALDALTKTPAQLLNVYDAVGSLDVGKWANLIVSSGPLFDEKSQILQNWIQGEKYELKTDEEQLLKGVYALTLVSPNIDRSFTMTVKNAQSAQIILKDTLTAKFSHEGSQVSLVFGETKKSPAQYRLNGIRNGKTWNGTGLDSLGNSFVWTAVYRSALSDEKKDSKPQPEIETGVLRYPNNGYGVKEKPVAQNLLFTNATVWTNEAEGVLNNADVWIKDGKIVAVGRGLKASGATVVDATGKHISPGIIDEHSHIAAASINEGGQSVTSEVRIADVLNPDDINIYRQLSGGVTSSHILHGSANTIGGQTQLIKLRWGSNAEELKFKSAPGFIKFALGENVKRTGSRNNNRFPDSRMGVQQVQMDAFTRAKEYQEALKGPNARYVRRDLELDALVEIMNKERFITCHSYVQSEILETMRMAEQFGFTVNTFTHILEGYKVADLMKAHGANASTFSDWWAYKLEVQDAIPYNPGIMHKVGLNVAINSDDAEMARRLNQEAAKSVKYSGMSEEDALKMVTLNPAKMLHIEERVGSLKPGKDADLVVWSDAPLSMYAIAEKTIVDGIVYFDREKDKQTRIEIQAERNRLIRKMLGEKKQGKPTQPATPSYREMYSCEDHDHSHGLLILDLQ